MSLVLKILQNLQVQRKGSESCSPWSYSGDQYLKVKVLATRNPRFEESLEINLMHSLSSRNLALLFFNLIARGEQSLAVGVCWRSISMVFAANISPDFMKDRP